MVWMCKSSAEVLRCSRKLFECLDFLQAGEIIRMASYADLPALHIAGRHQNSRISLYRKLQRKFLRICGKLTLVLGFPVCRTKKRGN